jgi:fibronectin-binding autotransporter adhesin
LSLILAGTITVLGVRSAGADTLYWDGDGSGTVGGGAGTWDVASTRWCTTSGGNTYQAWVNNSPADDAVFQNTAGTVTLGAAVGAGALTFNTASYTLLISGYTMSATNLLGTGGNSLTVKSASSTAASRLALNLPADRTWSGTLEANSLSGAQTLTLEKSGAGTTLTLNGTTKPSNGSSGARIEFSVLGGTLKLGDNIQMTSRDTATSHGNIRLNVASGATFEVNGGNKKAGAVAGLTFGSITLASGAMLTDSRASGDPVVITAAIGSTVGLTLAGDITGRLSIARSDTTSKNLTLSGLVSIVGDASVGTGGTLTLSGGAGNNVIGGTQTGNLVISQNASIGALTGSGTVDLGAKTLTLGNSADNNQTRSGVISGSGGAVAKVGGNTQRLSNANTYTGGTTIHGGALLVNNTTGSGTGTGAVTVNALGMLGGNGTIKPAAGATAGVSLAGTLAPGDGGVGTNTFDFASTSGGLVFNPGASIACEIKGPGTNDLVRVLNYTAGDVTFADTAVNVASLGGSLGKGSCTLMRFYSDGGTTPVVHGITSGLRVGAGLAQYPASSINYAAEGGTAIALNVQSGGTVILIR